MPRWSHVAILAALAFPSGANGQSSIPSGQRLFAITNARIEIGNGTTLDKGTLVIRDGMIVAVGPLVAVPPGAEVLDGTGLVVYPGFIDAYTNKLLTLPPIKAQQDDPPATADYASAFMREANRMSIRPEVRAADYLNLDPGALKGYRNAGFTSAVVAPDAGIIGGLAAFVNLGGQPVRDSVLEPRLGMTMGVGARTGGFTFGGGYPGTALGKIALLRQTLLDADWFERVDRAYAAGATRRPPYDPTLDALKPVLGRKTPALFEADGEFEVIRALDLAHEFNLRPMVAGGTQAWKDVDRLRNVPVLLSLAYGDEPKEPAKPAKPSEEDEPPDSRKIAEERRLFQEKVHNASVLDNAGIEIAFSTRGCKDIDDFMSRLRRVVKEGLPKAAALRGLTVAPAKIFGLDARLGTLEVGKLANVTVLSGDFLDTKSKVKMLYIDGRKLDPAQAAIVAPPQFNFGGEN